VLRDVVVLNQVQLGAAFTYTGKVIMTPNGISYSVSGGTANQLPQAAIWDEYAKLYEFYMVEAISVTYYPAVTRVETTTTGIQDTAILPTASGHLPDTASATVSFFNPAINLVVAQQ